MVQLAKWGTEWAADEQMALFSRAIMEHDEDAWSHLYRQYYYLVLSWIGRCYPLLQREESETEALVNAAFAKLAQFLTPEKLRQFPTSRHLFRYFKLCTQSVVADEMRRRYTRQREESLECLEYEPMLEDCAERVLATVTASEVWQTVQDCLWSDEERVVAFALFVRELPPVAAYSTYQQYFASRTQFYRVRRRVLERIRSHPRMRVWRAQMSR